MGCIHLYCGDGKGKTTAAVGLAVRVAGSGGKVFIARFLKNDDSGEVSALCALKGVTVFPCEKTFGFTWQMEEEKHREAAVCYGELLDHAFRTSLEAAVKEPSAMVLLVLDEICAAVKNSFVEEEALLTCLKRRTENMEIVMTGREPSDMMIDRADYMSEICKRKHPFDSGTEARKGIEY